MKDAVKIGVIGAINLEGIYAVNPNSSFSIRKNGIPWSISPDFQNFKTVTLGEGNESNAVIMGSETKKLTPYLEGRINILLTSKKENPYTDGTHIANSVEEAIELAKKINPNLKEIWFIGGKRVWEEGLKIADYVLITLVYKEIPAEEGPLSCESLLFKNLEKDFKIKTIEDKLTPKGLRYSFNLLTKK